MKVKFNNNNFRYGFYVFFMAFVISMFILAVFSVPYAAADNNRYLLFKTIDKNSDKNINSVSITVNKSVFTTSNPTGFFTVDTKSEQLKNFDFLDITAQKDGYHDATIAVSLKNPKIMQPVKVYMSQKMSEVTGRIVGCWYDSTGHHYDDYKGEEISVYGETLSHQMIMYKFGADRDGYFKIDHLPVGTYEITIRHKNWPIHIGHAGMVIEHDFIVRSCNRDEFHKKPGEAFKKSEEIKDLKINMPSATNENSIKNDDNGKDDLKLKIKDDLKIKKNKEK